VTQGCIVRDFMDLLSFRAYKNFKGV